MPASIPPYPAVRSLGAPRISRGGWRPYVYLSARISPDAHGWNDAVTSVLRQRFDVFKPQDENPCDVPHERLQPHVFQQDLEAMQRSDLGLLLAPYGRDCAWEAGWYAGAGKPLVAYVEHELGWLRDWMIKGGLSRVITSSAQVHARLEADPIVGGRCQRIESRVHLGPALMDVLSVSAGVRRGPPSAARGVHSPSDVPQPVEASGAR